MGSGTVQEPGTVADNERGHYRLATRIYDPASDGTSGKWGGRATCSCGEMLGKGSPYNVMDRFYWLECSSLVMLVNEMRKLWVAHRKAKGVK